MSHEINSIAYTGQKPWHGLGTMLEPGASIDQWIRDAGMAWKIHTAAIEYAIGIGPNAAYATFDGMRVLYRSDTTAPLSVVSKTYKVVQPRQVLEFYRDLVDTQGYELETAGCLRGGRKFWALARMRETIELPGVDTVEGYLLFATSCDGTLSTSIIPTSIRVVCANTLHATLHGAEGSIKVPHSSVFDEKAVKVRLSVARSQWDDYATMTQAMSRKSVSKQEAIRFFEHALGSFAANDGEEKMRPFKHALTAVQNLYAGGGKGSDLPSSKGTVWGLVNAISEYADYGRKTRSEDTRLSSAWFGAAARMKQRALEQAIFIL